ncbi:unnamed protein product [Ilex paraguariensis]|uniref:AB hydrolase-1 domain-containing protein n=1 Tax=Ilex paraguariensis TaxID=185542 RepID=A0ABC8RLJ0_9AQUA
MHVAELGRGPVVLFLHCFPELWYTWRHQMVNMATQGFQEVAPDLRGNSDTTSEPTNDATKFSTLHVVADIVALIDAAAQDQDMVFVVAHDWGALIAWALVLYRPHKVKGLVNMSFVFTPRSPQRKPIETLRAVYGDDYYISRFQCVENIMPKKHQHA